MSNETFKINTRRGFLAGSAAMLASPALAQTAADVNSQATTETERDVTEVVRRNISSFRTLDWQPYFDNTVNGAILVDIDSRAVHYWSEDQSVYKLYPSSVPLTQDLTRRGRTQVMLKDPQPDMATDTVHAGAQPRVARVHRPRPGQPTWHPLAAPELDLLPDPRHPRYAQDRAQIFQWLHRSVQRAYRGALRYGESGHTSVANLTTWWRCRALTR